MRVPGPEPARGRRGHARAPLEARRRPGHGPESVGLASRGGRRGVAPKCRAAEPSAGRAAAGRPLSPSRDPGAQPLRQRLRGFDLPGFAPGSACRCAAGSASKGPSSRYARRVEQAVGAADAAAARGGRGCGGRGVRGRLAGGAGPAPSPGGARLGAVDAQEQPGGGGRGRAQAGGRAVRPAGERRCDAAAGVEHGRGWLRPRPQEPHGLRCDGGRLGERRHRAA
mmetsp:Transcript_25650/g.96573  ORF Transcript_25650/g.96573 Transcript_25650/m.96573 type:complete len:225 (-) Transcript_25650:364-1038(-)